MLTNQEFELVVAYVEQNPRMGARKVLEYIEDNFVSLAAEIHSSRINNANVTKIHPDRPSEHFDKTRNREIEQGFKVRTEGESRQGQKSDPFGAKTV